MQHACGSSTPRVLGNFIFSYLASSSLVRQIREDKIFEQSEKPTKRNKKTKKTLQKNKKNSIFVLIINTKQPKIKTNL